MASLPPAQQQAQALEAVQGAYTQPLSVHYPGPPVPVYNAQAPVQKRTGCLGKTLAALFVGTGSTAVMFIVGLLIMVIPVVGWVLGPIIMLASFGMGPMAGAMAVAMAEKQDQKRGP